MDIVSYILSKKYTDVSLIGGGAIKGKNCTILSIESIEGGQRVTFQWELDNGTVQTDTMDVMDGTDGVGIANVEVSATNHLLVTYTNGNEVDAGLINVLNDVDDALSDTSKNPVQNKVVKGAIDAKLDKSAGEVKTTTDTFTTVNGGLLEECIINLEPVQSGSGDPSPDNVRPISGHTEVDLINDGKNRYIGSPSFDGFYNTASWNVYSETLNGHEVRYKDSNWNGLSKDIYLPVGTYTFSASVKTDGNATAAIFTSGGTSEVSDWISINTSSSWARYSLTFTVTKSGTVRPRVEKNSGTGNVFVSEYQIVKGSIATPYKPYLGHLYQVQIGSTVYGGTVDLVSGVMTVDRVIFEHLEDVNYSYGSTATVPFFDSVPTFTPDIDLDKLSLSICSDYKFNMIAMTSANDDGTFYITSSKHLRFCNLSYTDANTFKASLAGVKLIYYVANPITIQLTPQQIEALVGENNLSCPLEGQSIDSVKYREVFAFDDVEKVVSLRVPISMLGTDESGRTTASQSYASGDYFYKDGYMCKALTSISAGATLTLNTNYSQGTLADILKAIENA